MSTATRRATTTMSRKPVISKTPFTPPKQTTANGRRSTVKVAVPTPEPEGLRATVELVTPELAKAWLLENIDYNRKVKRGKVDAMVRDIKARQFRLTGQAIQFDSNGKLFDGQNRLVAVIEADMPVQMLVARGVDPKAVEVVDSGSARTTADVLHMKGEANWVQLAAAARLGRLYESGKIGINRNQATHSELLDFVKLNPDLRAATGMAVSFSSQIDIPPSALAAAIWTLRRVDEEKASQWFTQLATGTYMAPGEPVLALSRRITAIRRNNLKMGPWEWLSLIIRAWNATRAGKSLASIPIVYRSETGVLPEPK